MPLLSDQNKEDFTGLAKGMFPSNVDLRTLADHSSTEKFTTRSFLSP